ncbi:hypothetical protein UA08_06689 [Talaromyces atroroseus]|uniref:Uncharacterized protein n=1 Tax=Talaromyces atroroseus TaxID=1441469 RepID=A0A225AFT6_TALAT|nr:hypothetical protein UA08_06689 [Talaromyces atroroseus]OKL58003.1 hypothetical protein UA08_06689 [Talaromyces atroroseus]
MAHCFPGVEREMQICHSQPHLVPPMKLVFYGDLPSPGGTIPQSRSSLSLPPWIHETKTMANRASQRASVLLARRKTQSRPIIGAPTNFRRVDTPRRRSSFRPLELSIYSPGNRLSDLPEFSHFDLDSPVPPSPLPKALMSPFNSAGHRRRESGPFQLARKPVGSAPSRRNSFATFELQLHQAQAQQAQARQSLDAILLSPLIPHFSVLNTTDLFSQQYVKSPSENQHPVESSLGSPVQNNRSPTEAASLEETSFSPKSPDFSTDRSSFDHQRRNTTNANGKRQPSQTQPLSFSRHTTTAVHHQSSKSSSTFQTHSRIRTTSNSTVSSRTPSLSSAITAATTILPSDKDIDSAAFTALPMIPASVKNSVVVEEPQVHDEQDLISGGYEYDRRFPLSPVGVAF